MKWFQRRGRRRGDDPRRPDLERAFLVEEDEASGGAEGDLHAGRPVNGGGVGFPAEKAVQASVAEPLVDEYPLVGTLARVESE